MTAALEVRDLRIAIGGRLAKLYRIYAKNL